jgi:hypothetical protein
MGWRSITSFHALFLFGFICYMSVNGVRLIILSLSHSSGPPILWVGNLLKAARLF